MPTLIKLLQILVFLLAYAFYQKCWSTEFLDKYSLHQNKIVANVCYDVENSNLDVKNKGGYDGPESLT